VAKQASYFPFGFTEIQKSLANVSNITAVTYTPERMFLFVSLNATF